MSKKIQVPKVIYKTLWTKYLPYRTIELYGLIAYLTREKIYGESALNIIKKYKIQGSSIDPRVVESKREFLNKINKKYPENKKEDLELLADFQLIKLTESGGEKAIILNNNVKLPEDVLNLDDNEKEELENIRFELDNQKQISEVIDYIVNKDFILENTVGNIVDEIEITVKDFKKILRFLIRKEKMVELNSEDSFSRLKRDSEVELILNKKLFNDTRIIIE